MSKILTTIGLLVASTVTSYAQTNCTTTDVGNGTVLTNCQGRNRMNCITFTLPDGRVITNCN